MTPDPNQLAPSVLIREAAEWKPDTPGIFEGLTMAQYLDAPGVSRSLLRRVAERPSTATQSTESTDAQEFGTLLNDLVIFGTRNYHVRPDWYDDNGVVLEGSPGAKRWNGNSNVCKAWLKEHRDKPVLPANGEHSATWLERARMAVEKDARAQALFKVCGLREASLFARSEDYHFMLKSRPDFLAFDGSRAIFADLKSTTDASTRGFAREVLKFGYHKQAALARQICHKLGASPFEAYFIIVEKGESPRVQVRRLAERALDKGDFDLDDEMQIYHRCRIMDTWPDFADEPESHITGVIDLPEHCYKGEIREITASVET